MDVAKKIIKAQNSKELPVIDSLVEKKEYSDQMHLMTDDEKIDEASEESFPASDPPGFRSKSSQDKLLHNENNKSY